MKTKTQGASAIKTFGDRLRAQRMELGLQQKKLAAQLGVSEDTESNRVVPSKGVRVEDIGGTGAEKNYRGLTR